MKPTTTPASWSTQPKELDMSTATHTIDATHFTPPAPPVRTPRIRRALQGGVDQAPHPALHLADSGHGHCHIGCPGNDPLCLPGPTVVHHDSPAAPDRSTRPPVRCSASSSSAPCCSRHLGVRAVTAEYVDGDDSVHLHRHAHQTAGTGSQGWGHCGVRVPGGAAGCRGQLRSRPAGLRRQASPSVLRLIPASSKRWSSVPWR